MKTIRIIWFFTALIIFCCFIGCFRSAKPNEDNGPVWINNASGFVNGLEGKGFYGIGVASNIPDLGLLRNTADAMARTELAKSFKSKIKNMMKIYRAESGENEASFEQHVQEVTKTFTSMDLVGSRIVDRYYDRKNNVQYSLAVLNPNELVNEIKRMSNLTDSIKELLVKNSDAVFDKMIEDKSIK